MGAGMKRAHRKVATGVEALRGDLRLAWFEWRGLLTQSLAFEFEKRIESSPLYEPLMASLETISENVKKISVRGHLAKLRLSRILVRLAGSVLHKNQAAFEAALRDLIELGKSV
jgi:hypothetical protein